MPQLTPQQVKNMRFHSGLTLRELAGIIGCHYMSLWRWETGQQQVSEKFAVRLAFIAYQARAGRACTHCHGTGVEPPGSQSAHTGA